MRLFITGGTGFLGSHVLAAALSAGYEVQALRRKPLSAPALPLAPEPIWIVGDLLSIPPTTLDGVDAIIHLASAGVSPQQASWHELVQTNVIGSLRLLELAAEAGVRRCVFAGTSHEYGTAARRFDAIPSDAPLEPLSSYGASKAAAFQLLRAFAIERRLELYYGRIFSAYGEGQFEGNFWPSLRRAAIAGEDFPMTSGEQINDFIPASTVAMHLLEGCKRTDIKPGVPLVNNIGSGIAMSLISFAETEWKRLEAKGSLLPNRVPSRPDQIERCVPELTSMKPINHTREI